MISSKNMLKHLSLILFILIGFTSISNAQSTA
ncbi:MAG: hypothetical protein ACI8ZQ_001225, partial [Bacteroidia bacterium]